MLKTGGTMSYFQGAHHFNVDSVNITTVGGSSRNARDVLYNHIAPGAIHDSSERCDAPRCHAQTRKAVQEEIVSWITHGDRDDEPCKVMWLTGPAGAGKTAIAGSIAEICEHQSLLAATFFFSSFSASVNRRYKRCVIPTIALQLTFLAGHGPLGDRIMAAVSHDPAIFDKRLQSQMEALILQPLRQVHKLENIAVSPKILIFDGIDEVVAEHTHGSVQGESRAANERDQLEILSTLMYAAKDPSFPFRILIASRPEAAIRQFFQDTATLPSRELFLGMRYAPDSDIHLFLTAKIVGIRRRYGLPISWCRETDILTLTSRASGQFIYAATAVRYLETGTVPPHERLRCLLSLQHDENGVNPFATLDALYTHVLKASPQPRLAIQWISVMESGVSMLKNRPMRFVKQLLEEYPGQAIYLFENLTSLVQVFAVHKTTGTTYALHHKSLLDYFESPLRCGHEFHEAFLGAIDELYWPRITMAFKTQPRCGLRRLGSETKQFAEDLLYVLISDASVRARDRLQMATYIEYVRHQDDLLGDKLWWMLIFVLDNVESNPSSVWNFVVIFFNYFHHTDVSRKKSQGSIKCRQTDHSALFIKCDEAGVCTIVCDHWRSRILYACKAHDWSVPSASDLLRRFMHSFVGRVTRLAGFKPNFRPEQCSSRPKPVTLEYPARGSRCDDDYETLIDSVWGMYSELPSDWDSRYEYLSRGIMSMVGTGKDLVIDRICEEAELNGYIISSISEASALYGVRPFVSCERLPERPNPSSSGTGGDFSRYCMERVRGTS
ncbi:hypothetical protein NMY22_g17329 [Coprinellus aureogranulatus]|nr:hypothetical protein NMY22_g17329 [Coprinellus aureogranulatus]